MSNSGNVGMIVTNLTLTTSKVFLLRSTQIWQSRHLSRGNRGFIKQVLHKRVDLAFKQEMTGSLNR